MTCATTACPKPLVVAAILVGGRADTFAHDPLGRPVHRASVTTVRAARRWRSHCQSYGSCGLPRHRPVPILGSQWSTFTRETARAIRANTAILPGLGIYGPVLADDEAALLSAELTYSRFYGADGGYQRSDLFVVGHPAVMIGSLAVDTALDAHRQARHPRRGHAPLAKPPHLPVIATTQRLICAKPTRGFLSFYYAAVTEFHPDLHTWTVTLGFGDQCSPLRLYGPPTPALSLWAAVAIEGHRWHTPTPAWPQS